MCRYSCTSWIVSCLWKCRVPLREVTKCRPRCPVPAPGPATKLGGSLPGLCHLLAGGMYPADGMATNCSVLMDACRVENAPDPAASEPGTIGVAVLVSPHWR
jgi:hypothetical protein